MANRKMQNLIYDMQIEYEEPQNKRKNFDRPTVSFPNFPRFLDPTMLVNGRAPVLNEVSLSSPRVFHSNPNLATSLTTVLDQYPVIGKHQKFCTIAINQLSRLLVILNERQPPEVFCKKMRSEKFLKIHRKTPVLKAPLSNKQTQEWIFPGNFEKFLRTHFLQNTSRRLFLLN